MGSFGTEMKDFLGAATTVYKIAGSREDREYKKARTAYMKAKGDLASDPAMRDLAKTKLQAQIDRLRRGPQLHPAQIDKIKAQTDYYRSNMPGAGGAVPSPVDAARPVVGPQGAIESPYDTASGYDDMGQPQDTTADALALGGGNEYAGDYNDDLELASARGGMITKPKKAIKVKGYAYGGTVEDDDVQDSYDDADNASAENYVADDVDADAGSEPDADGDDPVGEVGAVNARREADRGTDYQAAHEAALAGVKYSIAHHQAAHAGGAEDVPGSGEGEGGALPVTEEVMAASRKPARPAGAGRAARAHLSGEGSLPVSTIEALKQKIDPDHKLSEDELNMRMLGDTWKWLMVHKGDQAAESGAAGLTQYMRTASDRYRALMQVAAENGDVNGTIKNAARMYANVPDGRDVKFSTQDGKIKATFTDQETGKEVEKFLVPPDKLLQWATDGGAQSFDGLLARSAAGRKELADRKAGVEHDEDRATSKEDRAAKAAAADVTAKQNERKTQAAEATAAAKVKDTELKANAPMPIPAQTALKKEIDDHIEGDPEIAKAEGKALPEIQAVAKQIAIKNSGSVDGPTAVRVAREMTQVDPANPKRITWDAVKDDKTGYYNVTLSNGTTARIPPDSAKRLYTLRTERATAAQAALDKAAAAGARTASSVNAGIAAAGNVGPALYGNPAPARGVPVLGPRGPLNLQSVPLDEAPPGSIPQRGLGER